MTYFAKLVKEVAAEDRTVRGAQIERLTIKGKFADALKVFTSVAQSILRDVGITKAKSLDKGYAKDRNYSIIYEVVFAPVDKVDLRMVENSAKEFLGADIKFTVYFNKETISMYVEIPIEGK